jgi:hypothetical protein
MKQFNLKLKTIISALLGILVIAGIVFGISKLPERAPPLKQTDKDSEYLYVAGNNTFEVMFGHKETKTPKVEFSVLGDNDSKATATFTMLGANNETSDPQKKGKELTFENVMPNVDLRYKTLPNGVKEEIVLKEKVNQDTFQFTLDIDNAYPSEITKGFPTPTFYDVDGNYLFHFEKPYAYDKKGAETHDASIQVRKGNSGTYKVLVSVNKEWLDHEDRVYPIYIDPTIVHDTSAEMGNDSLNRSAHSGDTGINPAELTTDDSTFILVHMNEGADNTCAGGTNDICDSSTNGYDGAFTNDVTHTASAKLGAYATTFDGTGDYVDFGDKDITSGEMTIEAWIYPTTITGGFDAIFSKETLSFYNYAGDLHLYIGGDILSPDDVLTLNQWQHVAVSIDEANNLVTMYLNGEEIARNTAWAGTIPTGSNNTYIGRYSAVDQEYFQGRIDEVRISDSFRSTEEIRSTYSQRTIHTTYQELPADEHTVGLWHMNEGTDNSCSGGEDVCDSSGNSNDGTFSGTTFTTNSKLGDNATIFDGTNDYIQMADSASLDINTAITIEGWVYVTASKDSTENQYFVDKQNLYSVIIEDDETITFYAKNLNTVSLTTTQTISLNNWHHLAVTYDSTVGANNAKIYIDGNLSTEATRTNALGIDANPFRIGCYSNTDGACNLNWGMNGAADEVRISNIARTPEEIKASASRRPYSTYTSDVIDMGAAVESWTDISWSENGVNTTDGETLYSSTDLVAHWKFNETSGTTADNAEGTAALDGTLTNFGSTGSQDAAAGTGWTSANKKWGAGGLMFDGDSGGSPDYIDIGNDSTLNFTSSDFSIESWIRIDDAISGSANYMILNRGTINTEGYTFRINGNTGGGSVVFITSQSGAYQQTNSAAFEIQPGKWYHVAAVRDGATTKVYKNGKDVTLTSGTHINPATSTANAYIGQRGSTDYFKGTMDTTRVYSRALTETEILANYNSSNIEFQTRTGRSSDPNDGTWEDWKPSTNETQILSLDSDATNWAWDSLATNAPTTDTDDTTTYYEGSGALKITNGTPQVDGDTVALWHLDETNGDNDGDDIFDATANNNDGEFVGTNVATAVADGISGKAREFNGSDDYVSISDSNSLDIGTSDFTIEAWVKHSGSADIQTVFDKRDNYDGGGYAGYALLILSTNETRLVIDDGGGATTIDSTAAVPTDSWQHIALVADRSGNATHYLNGVANGSGSISTRSGSLANALDATIGAEDDASEDMTDFFDGEIDEIRVSNVIRTAEEIAEAYRSGRDHYINKTISSDDLSGDTTLPFYIAADRPGTYLETTVGESAYANYQPDANTVGLWHMDEGTDDACNAGSDDVCDASGNGHHGDENGSPTPGVIGKTGFARDFIADSDYIEVPDSAEFTLSQNFTIEAWINPDDISDDWKAIVGTYSGGTSGWILALDNTAGNALNFYDGTWIDSNIAIAEEGTWKHVAVVNNAGDCMFYVNGVHGATVACATTDLDGGVLQIGDGGSGWSGFAYHFDGRIDEVRVSDTVRTTDEIRQAYEVGRRTHPITIDFAASLGSGDLIADSSDKYFVVDETAYGAADKAEHVYSGDKIIVRETVDATEYIAQGVVSSVNKVSGEVSVIGGWDTTSTFPSSGYTANATVFKWQKEYFDLSSPLSTHIDAVTNLTLRVTNGHEGRTIWLDDLNSSTGYLSTNTGSTITSATGNRFMQYRAILASSDTDVSANVSDVTLDYVTKEPEGYWQFDEGYGTTSYDHSSNVNNGTITGATWMQEDMCVSGKCLEFDGNDEVQIADTDELDFGASDDFTISTWFKQNGDTITDSYGGLWDKRDTSDNGYTCYYQNVTANLRCNLSDGSNHAYNYDASGAFDGNWHHLAWVIDNTDDKAYLYIDGVLNANEWDISGYGSFANTDPLFIGSYNQGSYISGRMDEFKIYSYALSQDEVLADFNAASPSIHGASASYGPDEKVFLSDGLVGYWKMDETAADSCTGASNDNCDSSGNSNDGAWNGTTASGNGKFGSGVSLDGNSDYVQIADANSLDISDTISVSLWAYADTLSGWDTFISKFGDGGGGTQGDLYIYSNDGTLGLVLDGPKSFNWTTSVTMSTLTWTHITVTYDGEYIRFYKNGVLEDTLAGTGALSLGTNSNDLYIGYNTPWGEYWDGTIDDVRIYDKVLSPTDIQNLYNWAPGPIAHWKFDENEDLALDDTVEDSSSNGYTGTASGLPGSKIEAVNGKFGGSYQFEDDALIKYGDVLDLAVTDTRTFTAWIKPSQVSGNEDLITKQESNADYEGWGFIQEEQKLRFEYITTLTSDHLKVYTTDNVLTASAWHHVVAIFDSGTVSFYVNGTEVSTNIDTDTLSSSTDSTTEFCVGGRNNAQFELYDGVIDDVRIYDYARTASQIIEDMNAGHPAPGSPIGSAVGWWKFDEGADNTCSGGTNDVCNAGSQSTTLDGTSTATRSESGKFGKALDFDSTDDVVTITNDDSIDFGNGLSSGFTFSTWINVDSDGEGDQGEILEKAAAYFLRTQSESAGKVDLRGSVNLATTNATLTVSSALNIGQWHHVALAWTDDSDDEISIYVDGVYKGSSTNGVGTVVDNASNLLIGGSTDNNFDGEIDDFRVYQFELTAEQIKAEYNQGKAAVFGATSTASDGTTANSSSAREYCVPGDTSTCNAPVAHWKFDENTGTTTTYDTSGNGNDGTMGSMTEASWLPGKHGSALDHDGASDYVAVDGLMTALASDETGTISFWTYIDTDDGNQNVVFSISRDADATISELYINYDMGNDRFGIFLRSDATTHWSLATPVNSLDPYVGEWLHISITQDGVYPKIYFNGASQTLTELTADDATKWLKTILTDATTKPDTANIGTLERNGSDLVPFDGKVDDMRIYDYARTPGQVAWEYNRGKPLSWWKLDECTGTTAYDSGALGNNGTITIGATGANTSIGTCSSGTSTEAWNNGTTGKLNSSLDFDGTDDTIAISTIATDVEEITVAAWINREGGYGAYRAILNSNGWAAGFLHWQFRTNDTFGFSVNGSSPADVESTTTFTTSGWHHVATTYDSNSKVVSIYVDGELDKQTTLTTAREVDISSAVLHIGSWNADRHFNGKIDDVRIYNYEMTSQQIHEIYNAGAVNFN